MGLTARDYQLVGEIVENIGLTERNILEALTGSELKAWVMWAICGRSEEEILAKVFSGRKTPSPSMVKYAIQSAQLKIVATLIEDEEDLDTYFSERPELKEQCQKLYQDLDCIIQKRKS